MEEVRIARSGTPIGLILTLIFVVLKLTDNIDWSWVWVLSPIWISISFFGSVLLLLVFVTSYLEYRERKVMMKKFKKETENIYPE